VACKEIAKISEKERSDEHFIIMLRRKCDSELELEWPEACHTCEKQTGMKSSVELEFKLFNFSDIFEK